MSLDRLKASRKEPSSSRFRPSRKGGAEHSIPVKGGAVTNWDVTSNPELSFQWLKFDYLNRRRLVAQAWTPGLPNNWPGRPFACDGMKRKQPETADRVRRRDFEPSKAEPKGQHETITAQITGLPKCRETYGNRDMVVPLPPFMRVCRTAGVMSRARGSISGRFRVLSQRHSHGCGNEMLKKYTQLTKFCSENPDRPVDRNLYSIMQDPDMYMIAYDKLKSRPGNMTPGLKPETLDGISMD